MIDRVSANPGRVLITPESGEAYYATLTRADNPTVEGTPLNKSTLLTDATAALFGLGSNAVPDDVFEKINESIDNINEKMTKFTTGSYTGNGDQSRTISLGFRPLAVFVFRQNGGTYFKNPNESNFSMGGLAVQGSPAYDPDVGSNVVSITSTGFTVYYLQIRNEEQKFRVVGTNFDGYIFNYIAFYR